MNIVVRCNIMLLNSDSIQRYRLDNNNNNKNGEVEVEVEGNIDGRKK